MPLKPGSSRETISQNIREFHTGETYAKTSAKFGKAKANKQAIAVALSTARKYKKKALGGPNIQSMVMKNAMIGLGRQGRQQGLISSSVPGRTDKLPMNVRSGSYILPADIPSALGQGNTIAGGEILKKMFSSGPYGLPVMKGSAGRGAQRMGTMRFPAMPKLKADGGETEESDSPVPIIAAGGEYIIDPEVVRGIGNGSVNKGHQVLDQFVLSVRKDHIKTLKGLKPPKK